MKGTIKSQGEGIRETGTHTIKHSVTRVCKNAKINAITLYTK